jgi:tetratricopeptide (TPR) repeat protein
LAVQKRLGLWFFVGGVAVVATVVLLTELLSLRSPPVSKVSPSEPTIIPSDNSNDIPLKREITWMQKSNEALAAELQVEIDVLLYLWSQNRSDEFLDRLHRLIEVHPSESALFALKADFYADRQNWEAAEASLVEVLNLEPTNADIRASLAEVQLIQAKWPEALSQIEQVLAQDPRHFEALSALVSWGDLNNQMEEVRARIDDLHQQNPDSASLAMIQADLFLGDGNAQKRATVLEQAMRFEPEHPGPYRYAALDALARRDWASAVSLAEASLERDSSPESQLEALSILLRASVSLENWDLATRAMNERRALAHVVPLDALELDVIQQIENRNN